MRQSQHSSSLWKFSLAALAALAALAMTAAPLSAAVIYADDFSGGMADLNGAAPDVGQGTWVASSVFNQDGSIDPSAGSATLAFAPVDGNIYQLDASLSGVSGNSNWIALGFGVGQSTAIGTNNRFINGLLIGKAWMLFRGDTSGHQAFLGSATSGTANGLGWSALSTDNRRDRPAHRARHDRRRRHLDRDLVRQRSRREQLHAGAGHRGAAGRIDRLGRPSPRKYRCRWNGRIVSPYRYP